MAEIFTPEDAEWVAQAIEDIVNAKIYAALDQIQGAHRGYVWGIYDPAAIPRYIYTYEVDLPCQPVDCRVTTDRENPGNGSFSVIYSTNKGGSWQTLTTVALSGAIVGGTAKFELATLPVGTLLTIGSVGGGKGIAVNLRVRRIDEHKGAIRA